MTVGFVGLGTMGKYMALNVAKGGDLKIVNDVNDKTFSEFQKIGVETSSRLMDVAQADLIFFSLPNTEIVRNVILGENGLFPYLRKGQILVDLSTIKYRETTEIAEALEGRKIEFLDAPVSGMESRAKDGTLTVMCGGRKEVFNLVYPYLERIGNKILFMGPHGSGQLTKLINQLLFDINAAGLAEILPMAIKMGLDCEKVGQVVNSGTGRSYASEFFIPRIQKGNFKEGYLMKNAYKDLVSAAELGANLEIPMPVLASATTTYQMALLKGYGDCDKGGMIQVYEELLGVKFRVEE